MNRTLRIAFALLASWCLTLCVLGADTQPAIVLDSIFVALPGEIPLAVAHDEGTIRQSITPESTVYLPIVNASRAEDLTGLYAMALWKEGGERVGTPLIEYRMMYDDTGQKELGYRYVVAIPLVDAPPGAGCTVRGTLRVSKRNSLKGQIPIEFTIRKEGWGTATDSVMCDGPRITLDFSFDEGVMSLAFSDSARFEIDVTGQGLVNVGLSTQPLTDIVAQYPAANLRFLAWVKAPIFDHLGRLVIYADEHEYLYELVHGNLVSCVATFSEEDEAFVLLTRRLGIYVVSDRPLGQPQTPKPPDNPLTGVRNFELGGATIRH